LDDTGADLVFLPTLKTGRGVPGPLTALLVADRLALTDVLEVHQVPGGRLKAMSERLYAGAPNHCGGRIGGGSAKVGRRGIEPDRVYRIVTTDRLRASTVLNNLLQGAFVSGVLDRPGHHTISGPKGTPKTLRTVAMSAVERLYKTHGDELIEELSLRETRPADPLWLARVRGVSMRIEGFQGVGDEAYALVPETLATSPSSFTLGTSADLALDYAARRVGWDVRVRHDYTRLRTADQVLETADDVKLSSSVNLPGLTTPALAGVAFRPYSEGLFDSEWTPVEPTDGVEVPRQADLSLTLGLQATPKGWLRTLRLGMLVNQDLARRDKQAELGGRVEAQLSVPLGSSLKFTHQLDAFVYGNTPDEDASDLRFKGKLDSRLGLPLLRGLNVALYGGTFVFQGRVPETSSVRASFTLGASLDLSGVFAL